MEFRKYLPNKPPIHRRSVIAAAIAGVLVASGVFVEHNQSSHPAKSVSLAKTANGQRHAEHAKHAEHHTNQTHETHQQPAERNQTAETYPLHKNITATLFWVGEAPDSDNHNITNMSSAWVDNWPGEFGGIDDPNNRGANYMPHGFTPKENYFYFALPYNDLSPNGLPKPVSELKKIPWYKGPAPLGQSLLKNRWIMIIHNGRVAYGQWEDVGPFGEDDPDYVFGNGQPKSAENNHAGIDLSPALTDYLHLNGEAPVDWRFVDEAQVPNGPWKQIVTRTGTNWH
jgi:hypothetical protein